MLNLKSTMKVLVYGTGTIATSLIEKMQAYGTHVAALVDVGRGGQTLAGGVRVFDLVSQATSHVSDLEVALICNEPYRVLDAALEVIDAGINQLIITTGGIPPLDTVRLLRRAKASGTKILGPGSMGLVVPGKLLLGFQATQFYQPGAIAIVSCSAPLGYLVAESLCQAGLGISIAIDIGQDAILGSGYQPWIEWLSQDADTQAIVLVDHALSTNPELGHICFSPLEKPVFAYVAGHTIPTPKLSEVNLTVAAQFNQSDRSRKNTTKAKITALKKNKINVAESLEQIPELIKNARLKLQP
jgi:succinyl-CoA synthetase alpha subunit